MPQFKKKVANIEAWKFDTNAPKPADFPSVVEMNPFICDIQRKGVTVPSGCASIEAADGIVLIVHPGDYVVRDEKDQVYAIRSALFEALYEAV